MAKVDLLAMPIRVWKPMKDGDPCLAKIGAHLDDTFILFSGETPAKAYKAADAWRKEERAKWLAQQERLATLAAERAEKRKA
jgi:hypothetical protein